LRDENKCRPDPHGRVAYHSNKQPEPDLWSRPRSDQRYDQHDLERNMRRNPEPPSRNSAALWLDQIRTLGPEWVDDGELVERSADPDERQRTRYPGQKHNVVHRVTRG